MVEKDTLVRLMVLNEVSTRKAKPGDRFVLRVDEDVVVNGTTIIPVGTKAWGEVTSAEASGAVGKSGKLSAKLLYVEANGQRIPLVGSDQAKGAAGTTQVAMGVIGGLGLLGLLAPGNNAKLKAGDIINGSFETDLAFDPATGTISAVASVDQAPLVVPQRN
ncbi:MAG TPA: hypothetical protein VGR19_07380 [Allosphingosinicella sp.]|nr:hypothetical protein [Allosphingosinicella sp.]